MQLVVNLKNFNEGGRIQQIKNLETNAPLFHLSLFLSSIFILLNTATKIEKDMAVKTDFYKKTNQLD